MVDHEMFVDEEWEEWDPSKMPFTVHMAAGSMAGLMEHMVMYPVDTVKTKLQVMGPNCPTLSAPQLARDMLAKDGPMRLWRGSSTMVGGCIPAHAAYFSLFEFMKEWTGANAPGHSPVADAISGITATVAHDTILVPFDVCKQRLQLGYYKGVGDAFATIVRKEGLRPLFVSLPTTLFMNIPYGGVMVATNEAIKTVLNPSGEQNLGAFLAAGGGAGAAAALVTTPLDVAKTRLQTQDMSPLCDETQCPKKAATAAARAEVEGGAVANARRGLPQVLSEIWREEGWAGMFRGVRPRLLFHTPAVAISWATYESMKRTLWPETEDSRS